MGRQIAFLIVFAALMIGWAALLRWGIPQLPEWLVKVLGWGIPPFAFGFLFARWRALRAARKLFGDAAAESLNKHI